VVNGEPVQIVSPETTSEIAFVASAVCSPREGRSQAQVAARALYVDCPSLETGPLLSTCLVDDDPPERVLLLRLHHLTCDGLSLRLLVDELARLLAAARKGELAPPARTDLEYRDFAAWQRRRWEAGDYSYILEYWRDELTYIPTNSPSERSFCFTSQRSCIPDLEWHRLLMLARGCGATPFMVLAAAQSITQYKRGIERLRLATLIGVREHPDLEHVVGPFANTVVLSLAFGDDPSAATFLERVRGQALQSFAHAALPLGLVVDSLEKAQADGCAIADVGLNFEPPPSVSSSLIEVLPILAEELGPMIFPSGLPLNVVATPTSAGLSLVIEHEDGAIDAGEAKRMLALLPICARHLLEHPKARLSEISERSLDELAASVDGVPTL
jgi:hypothetical protein